MREGIWWVSRMREGIWWRVAGADSHLERRIRSHETAEAMRCRDGGQRVERSRDSGVEQGDK